MSQSPNPPRPGLLGVLIAVLFAASLWVDRIKRFFATKGDDVVKDTIDAMSVEQWLADVTAWHGTLQGRSWRAEPVRGLLAGLGRSADTCDPECVAGAALRLLETGDARFPSFSGGDLAAALTVSHRWIKEDAQKHPAPNPPDVLHLSMTEHVGRLCVGVAACDKAVVMVEVCKLVALSWLMSRALN